LLSYSYAFLPIFFHFLPSPPPDGGKPLLAFGQFGAEDNNFGLLNGIALGPDGKLWVADAGNNRIMQYAEILP
jgi:NHL repeat